jgi:hypothetical protein
MKRLCQGMNKQGRRKVPSCPHIVPYTLRTPSVSLGLFADDTCIYEADHKEGYVLRKLQQYLSAIKKLMKIGLRPSTFLVDLGPLRLILTLSGRNSM